MTFEDFCTYANILRSLGVKGIILTGGGEPTINPDFEKIVNWLENNNFEYGINTNFNVLKYFKPKYLKVSLDAYSESSYIKMRGVNAYEKTRFNIEQYGKWRAKNSPNTVVGIQTVATTKRAVRKFYNANKDLPIDFIGIRPIESTRGVYYESKREQRRIKNIILEIEKLSRVDSRVQKNYKWDMCGYKANECFASWSQIAIDVDGSVMFCCHKPFEIVGHITDKDILEKKAEFKTDMSKCDVPCRLSAPNQTLEIISKSHQHCNFI
jgi:MoaA/NifB/PqqE/SkfB family radical SAM enzyme